MKEFLHLQLFLTNSGMPDDSKMVSDLKIKEENTLSEFKNIVM